MLGVENIVYAYHLRKHASFTYNWWGDVTLNLWPAAPVHVIW